MNEDRIAALEEAGFPKAAKIARLESIAEQAEAAGEDDLAASARAKIDGTATAEPAAPAEPTQQNGSSQAEQDAAVVVAEFERAGIPPFGEAA